MNQHSGIDTERKRERETTRLIEGEKDERIRKNTAIWLCGPTKETADSLTAEVFP